MGPVGKNCLLSAGEEFVNFLLCQVKLFGERGDAARNCLMIICNEFQDGKHQVLEIWNRHYARFPAIDVTPRTSSTLASI